MNIKGREVKIDRGVLAKAIGIMCMSWLALPVVYYLLLKRKKGEKEEIIEEDDRTE